jgi:hypothetical protein
MTMRMLVLLAVIGVAEAVLADDVRVVLLDGNTLRGELTTLDRDHLTLGDRRIELRQVIAIDRDGAPPAERLTRFELFGGDAYTGRLVGCGDGLDTLQLDCPSISGRVELPGSLLAAVIYPAATQEPVQRKFLPRPARESDDAVQLRNGDLAHGTLQGIEQDDEGRFHYLLMTQDDTLRIRETDIDHAVLAPTADPPDTSGFHALIECWDGTTLSARPIELTARQLAIETLADSARRMLPLAAIRAIRLRNGRFVYLSDLPVKKLEVIPYFSYRFEPRIDRNRRGGPLQLRGTTYDKGIGMQSKTRMTYTVSGFERFRTIVGIDDAAGDGGSVICRLYLDGKLVKTTAVLRGGGELATIDLALGSASELMLEVDFADNAHVNDLASWVTPILIRP